MVNITLTPKTFVESIGRLSYNESTRSWGTLRFKSELIREFRQLKEKNSKFAYRVLLYRNYEEFEKKIKEMIKNKEPIPVLIWFEKESKKD
jgi:predicted CopG family antitoxin